jgi:hypothetical protein
MTLSLPNRSDSVGLEGYASMVPPASREPFDLAQWMSQRLERLNVPGRQQPQGLINWASWHLRTASLGWDVFQQALPLGDQNLTGHSLTTVEMAAENLIFRGSVSAMDLCAGAVYRLTGKPYRADRERDVGWWFDARWRQPWHLVPQPLEKWLRAFDGNPAWERATAFRDAFTHRTVQRHINVVVGGATTVTLQVGTHKDDAQVLMPQLVEFARKRYSSFERALARAYPVR